MRLDYLPGEYEKQKASILLFPYRTDVWRSNCVPARQMIVDLANIISDFQPVILGVLPSLFDEVVANYSFKKNVKLVKMKYNDVWPRDSVSNVILGGSPCIYNYEFNAYGGELYHPWNFDNELNTQVAELFNYRIKDSKLTLECGNIVTDGNKTIFAVKDAIVNENRNPNMSLDEIEKELKKTTCSDQIIWLPSGLLYDETGGHVDNIVAFANKNTMLVSYTEDVNHPQYEVTKQLYDFLSDAKNCDGEKYSIVKVPLPPIYVRTEADCEDLITIDGSLPRLPGDQILETYINFALVNGAVIVPTFNIPMDKTVVDIISKAFPDRKIITKHGREATLGGGGFHCLTKHIN